MKTLRFSEDHLKKIEACGIVAVLVVDRVADAVHVADALAGAGVGVVELTLRTPSALESLSAIKRAHPHLLVGAGTVLAPGQVAQVLDAGADFAVAPGCNPRVLAKAAESGLPFAPGIATPSDIEAALEHGCNLLKFFPAEPSGGLAYLKTMTAPYVHLGLRFIPLGGITEATAGRYLSEPAVAALGGSWIAPRELIEARDWSTIGQRAASAMAIVRGIRPSS